MLSSEVPDVHDKKYFMRVAMKYSTTAERYIVIGNDGQASASGTRNDPKSR